MKIKRDSKGRFVKGAVSHRKGMSREKEYGIDKALEIKRKTSMSWKGKINWKLGKTFNEIYKTPERAEEMRRRVGKLRFGIKSEKKGKTYGEIYGEEKSKEIKKKLKISHIGIKPSEKTRKKMSFAQKGKNLGKHHSKEAKLKMSLTRKGKNVGKEHPFYGKKHSKETRRKIKESLDKLKEKGLFKMPIQDTSIELKIQNFLKQLKIEFYTHYWINNIEHKYQCDIFIPSKNLIIECFGDYWHKIPNGNPIDSIRCQELREKGYRVFVFWEKEIKVMELNDFKERI